MEHKEVSELACPFLLPECHMGCPQLSQGSNIPTLAQIKKIVCLLEKRIVQGTTNQTQEETYVVTYISLLFQITNICTFPNFILDKSLYSGNSGKQEFHILKVCHYRLCYKQRTPPCSSSFLSCKNFPQLSPAILLNYKSPELTSFSSFRLSHLQSFRDCIGSLCNPK